MQSPRGVELAHVPARLPPRPLARGLRLKGAGVSVSRREARPARRQRLAPPFDVCIALRFRQCRRVGRHSGGRIALGMGHLVEGVDLIVAAGVLHDHLVVAGVDTHRIVFTREEA